MSGLGQQFLPRPNFSRDNPYWRIPETGMTSAYKPRLSAADFMYACTWEALKMDVHGACCVRQAMQRTFWINLRFGRIQFKEIAHEKAVG